MNQTELDVTALNGIVIKIFKSTRGWLTAYQLREMVMEYYDRWVSDSTVMSRKRDLQLSRYGGHQFEKRRLPHSHSCEYRLVGK